MLMRVSCQRMEVTLDRMVMPRSRSRSLESIARSATRWLSRKEPACCRSRSTSVVLPWSTWAMIATLRNVMQEIRWGPARPGQALRCNIGSASPTATPKSAKCLDDQEDAAAQRPPAALRRTHFLHQYRAKCGGFRAQFSRGQECPPGALRVPGLYALLRHLCARLQVDAGRARVHAAAGTADHCGLSAGKLAGPLHRREHRRGERGRSGL